MDCAHDPLMIMALVDGELDAIHAAETEARIETCPACAAEHARLLGQCDALRGEGVRAAAPDRLHARLATSLAEAAAEPAPVRTPLVLPARRPRPWAWMGGGAGLAFAASAAMFFAVGQVGQGQALTNELVASHVRSMQVAHLTDVATSDQHVVKPWFDGKLDFAPPVIELKPQGFPLVGGRMDYLNGRTVAAIVYQRGRHTINLFVWPEGKGDGADQVRQDQGYGLRHWRSGGMTYWAVSDVNPADLALFETDLRARTGG